VLDEPDVVAVVNAALSQGNDPAAAISNLARDILFSAGGWSDVELATGWLPRPNVGLAAPATVLPDTGDEADGTTLLVEQALDPHPIIDKMMRDFNQQFAMIADGGNSGIVRLAFNPELNRHMPVIMSPESFKLLFGNVHMPVPAANAKDGVNLVSAATLWLKHPRRRTCPDGVGLDPDGNLPASCWNLWQGFGVKEGG